MKDLLNKLVKKGASKQADFFSSQVGIGSSKHCLFGRLFISLVTSSTFVGAKMLREELMAQSTRGGARQDAVEARTFSVLLSKNLRNELAVKVVLMGI